MVTPYWTPNQDGMLVADFFAFFLLMCGECCIFASKLSVKRGGSVRRVLLFVFGTPRKVAHHACKLAVAYLESYMYQSPSQKGVTVVVGYICHLENGLGLKRKHLTSQARIFMVGGAASDLL